MTTLCVYCEQTTNWWYFSDFSRNTDFDVLCKLSKRQFKWNIKVYFIGKIRKRTSKCRRLRVLPSLLGFKPRVVQKINDKSAHMIQVISVWCDCYLIRLKDFLPWFTRKPGSGGWGGGTVVILLFAFMHATSLLKKCVLLKEFAPLEKNYFLLSISSLFPIMLDTILYTNLSRTAIPHQQTV